MQIFGKGKKTDWGKKFFLKKKKKERKMKKGQILLH